VNQHNFGKTILLFLFLVVPSIAVASHAKHPSVDSEDICLVSAYYSPHGGSAQKVVALLNSAHKEIRLAIYSLTHPNLVQALVDAKSRGVDVAIKADKLQSSGKSQKAMLKLLSSTGISVEISDQSRLLHHKFVVVDRKLVATGSFNWTVGGEDRNRENLVVLECDAIAQSFLAEWNLIQRNKP